MTVIRPNSVSGITSITAQANEINFFRSNGTLAGLQLNGVNFNTTTGISTFAALKVTGNLDVEGVLTYQDVTNVDSVGIITAQSGINCGGDLDITGQYLKIENSGSPEIQLTDTNAGNSLCFIRNSSGNLRLAADNNNAVADTSIRFLVDGGEKVRITSSGQIGIGTDAPAHALDIQGSSGSFTKLALSNQTMNTSKYEIIFGDQGQVNHVVAANREFTIATNGSSNERLRIKADGDVIWNGIGTQLPGEGNNTVGMGFEPRNGTIFLSRADNALIVSNRNNDGRHIHFNQGGTGKFAIGLQNSGANLTFFSGAGNSPSPKVHITSSGQLCIGTPTAVRALTIKNPGQIHVESTDTGNWLGMQLKGSSGTNNYNAYFGLLDSNGNFFIDNGSNGNDFVINQSGQITQPSQTSVMARPPGNFTIPNRDGVIAGTWTTNTSGCHNIGNDFNTSGGIYTAPVAGRYLVQWNIFLTNNTTRRDAYVQLNGSAVIREEIGDPEGTTGNNKSVSCQAVINMAANDVLRFGALTAGGTTVYAGVTPWSYCCVRLLG